MPYLFTRPFFHSCFTLMVEEMSTKFQNEHKEGSNLHATTTLLFCFSTTLFLVVLGLLVCDDLKKLAISKDHFIPHIKMGLPILSSPPSFNFCSNLKTGLTDWIAPKELWHSMNDEELLWRASLLPHVAEYPYNRTPKIAFMFLARERLPLKPLWERFFRGHEGLFSIYIHCSPICNEEIPISSVFYKRMIPSKLAEWGRATMIDAERRLLANALLDFSNERFVLVSDTCIPLFNFTTTYNYLIHSNQSYLGSFDDPRPIGRGRYNKRMWPMVSIFDWRKGSQWFEVQRKLAVEIVSDKMYYPIFKDHCNPPCYMDEHYLATLLVKLMNQQLNSNRSLTWVDWSTAGSHPKTFMKKDVSEDFLDRIRHGTNCTYNGSNSSICFLFARKFHPRTLEPLLQITPILFGFNP